MRATTLTLISLWERLMRILQYTFNICEGALFIPVVLLSLCNRLKEKINYKDREYTKVFVKLKVCMLF